MSSAQQDITGCGPHGSLRFQDCLITGSVCPGPTSPHVPHLHPWPPLCYSVSRSSTFFFFSFDPTDEWDPPSLSGSFLCVMCSGFIHAVQMPYGPPCCPAPQQGRFSFHVSSIAWPRGRAGPTPIGPFIFPADHSAFCCCFPAAWFKNKMWSLRYR